MPSGAHASCIIAVLLALSVKSSGALSGGTSKIISQHVTTEESLAVDSAVLHERQLAKGDAESVALVCGFLLGLVLWCMVAVCLWTNERIAIKQYNLQLKAERWALHIDEPWQEPIDAMNGRIAYVSGESTCVEELVDSMFPLVRSRGGIELRRKVEMHQWQETTFEDDKGNVTCSYNRDWYDCYQDVKHSHLKRNPRFPVTSQYRQEEHDWIIADAGEPCPTAKPENVRLGAYYLGEDVIRQLHNWQTKVLEPGMLGVPRSSHEALSGGAAECDGWWYFGGRMGEVGDIRVRFEELVTGPLTVCGVLTKTEIGWTFKPMIRSDAANAGEGFIGEMGGCCCLRVKELHFGASDPTASEDFINELASRPKERKGHLGTPTHSTRASSYDPENDIDDLCCFWPCSNGIVKLIRWFGLDNEYLGVIEDSVSLTSLSSLEKKSAASHHCVFRIVGLCLLVLSSYLVLSPGIRLLKVHWLIATFGGAIVSALLCVTAVLCAMSSCLVIMSAAWIFHRPSVAAIGLTLAVASLFAMCLHVHYKAERAASMDGPIAFLQLSRAAWGQ